MDWKSLIAELQERGATQWQIAHFCGCTQSTISYLCKEPATRPRYEIGLALKTLHGASKREMHRLLRSVEPKVA